MSVGLPAIAVALFIISVRRRGLSPLRLLVALIVLIGSAVSGATAVGAETGVAAINLESATAVAVDADIPTPIGCDHNGADDCAYDYDASSIAFAGGVLVGASPSSLSQLTAHREGPAVATALLRGASTTLSPIFVAPQTPLYRAVTDAEVSDLRAVDRFRAGPGYEGKLFATSPADAARFGQLNYGLKGGEPFHIVETRVSSSTFESL